MESRHGEPLARPCKGLMDSRLEGDVSDYDDAGCKVAYENEKVASLNLVLVVEANWANCLLPKSMLFKQKIC